MEVIDLVNDGTGLGFSINGGQQTGIVVNAILPGGVAGRDERLLLGDVILQMNQHWLKDVASEQVADLLRSCGTHVRLVVARPVYPVYQQQLEAHLNLSIQNNAGMVTLPDISDQYRVTSGVGPGSEGDSASLPAPDVTEASDNESDLSDTDSDTDSVTVYEDDIHREPEYIIRDDDVNDIEVPVTTNDSEIEQNAANNSLVKIVRNGNFMAEFFKSRRTWHGYVEVGDKPSLKSVCTQTEREAFGLTCNGSRVEYKER